MKAGLEGYTPITKDLGFDPLGGLGSPIGNFKGRRVQQNDGGIAKAKTMAPGPTQSFGRSVLNFIDAVTPKWCWPKAKFHRSLENFSGKVGQSLGGIFNHGGKGIDNKTVLSGLRGLRRNAERMVNAGADYKDILSTRLQHNLGKLTGQEIDHLNRQIDSTSWKKLKSSLSDSNMKEDLSAIEKAILQESEKRVPVKQSTSSKSNLTDSVAKVIKTVAQPVAEKIDHALKAFNKAIEPIRNTILNEFTPIEKRLKKADAVLDGMMADAKKDLDQLKSNLNELMQDRDLNLEAVNKAIDGVFEKYDDASLGKAIQYVTEEIHKLVEEKSAQLTPFLSSPSTSKTLNQAMERAKGKISQLTELYLENQTLSDKIKHGIAFERLKAAMDGLPQNIKKTLEIEQDIFSLKSTGLAIDEALESKTPNTEENESTSTLFARLNELSLESSQSLSEHVKSQMDLIDQIDQKISQSDALSKKDQTLLKQLLKEYETQVKDIRIEKHNDIKMKWAQNVSKTDAAFNEIKSVFKTTNEINAQMGKISQLHVCDQNTAHGHLLAGTKSALKFLTVKDNPLENRRFSPEMEGKRCTAKMMNAIKAIDVEIMTLALKHIQQDGTISSEEAFEALNLLSKARNHCIKLSNDIVQSQKGKKLDLKGIHDNGNMKQYGKALVKAAKELAKIPKKGGLSTDIITKFKYAVASPLPSALSDFEAFFDKTKVKSSKSNTIQSFAKSLFQEKNWETRYPDAAKAITEFIETAKKVPDLPKTSYFTHDGLCQRVQEFLRGNDPSLSSMEIHDIRIDFGDTIHLLIDTDKKNLVGKSKSVQSLKWIQLPPPQVVGGKTAYSGTELTNPESKVIYDFEVNRINNRLQGLSISEYESAHETLCGFVDGTMR